MRLVFMLTILVCYVNFTSTAIIELKQVSQSIRKDDKLLTGYVKTAQQIIRSLEGYESGSAVNAPGELVNLVQAFDKILPIFHSILGMIRGLSNIVIHGLSVSTGSGIYLNIPNAMLAPYAAILPTALDDIAQIIGYFRQAQGILQNQVIPLFSEESFDSAGSIAVPDSAIKSIMNMIHSGMGMAIDMLTKAGKAAKASKAAEPKGLSVKASTIMNAINNALSKAAKTSIPMIEAASKRIGGINIVNMNNGYDEINLKQVVMELNRVLENLLTFLNGANKGLGTILNMLNLVDNPIGGFFFNVI